MTSRHGSETNSHRFSVSLSHCFAAIGGSDFCFVLFCFVTGNQTGPCACQVGCVLLMRLRWKTEPRGICTKYGRGSSFLLFETRSHCVVQYDLELVAILLPQPSGCWDDRRMPPCLAFFFFSRTCIELMTLHLSGRHLHH